MANATNFINFSLGPYQESSTISNTSAKQVADPEAGWDFRPYNAELWRWLRATFQDTPFLLSSATLDTASLERIKSSLDIARQDVRVLTTSCDRPNIYQQSRVLKRRVDIW